MTRNKILNFLIHNNIKAKDIYDMGNAFLLEVYNEEIPEKQFNILLQCSLGAIQQKDPALHFHNINKANELLNRMKDISLVYFVNKFSISSIRKKDNSLIKYF